MRRTPTNACFVCHHTLEETGGKPIVSDHRFGLILLDAQEKATRGTAYLLANGLVLRIWGKRWDEVPVSRVQEESESDHNPSFCQRCMGHVCSVCRWPVIWPPGVDVIYADANNLHQMTTPAATQCSNLKCERFGPLYT